MGEKEEDYALQLSTILKTALMDQLKKLMNMMKSHRVWKEMVMFWSIGPMKSIMCLNGLNITLLVQWKCVWNTLWIDTRWEMKGYHPSLAINAGIDGWETKTSAHHSNREWVSFLYSVKRIFHLETVPTNTLIR